VQRAEAIYHDPYPLNDVGPEIVGGRPLAYQQPLNEVERSRLVPVQPVLIQPAPIPGMTVMAPPVVSSPFAVAPPQPGAPLVPAPGSVVTSASPVAGPPIVTSPYAAAPIAPAPVAAPYPVAPAPLVTSPYSPAAAPVTGPLPWQPRSPY
jgi:2-oxoglutarate dehydrogenase E2 component (dihydrolipoamide succinyltransferase)